MIYLAIDPGTTTGIAWYDEEDAFQPFGSAEIRGRHDLYTYLHKNWGLGLGADPVPDVVIIERWDVRTYTHKLTNQDDPRYIIGYVEGVCYMAPRRVRYTEQTPAEAKRFSTNKKLKTLGWYRGGEGHADDAARHLLVRLVKDVHENILKEIT